MELIDSIICIYECMDIPAGNRIRTRDTELCLKEIDKLNNQDLSIGPGITIKSAVTNEEIIIYKNGKIQELVNNNIQQEIIEAYDRIKYHFDNIKEFNIDIKEQLKKSIVIRAVTKDAAINICNEKYMNEEIILTADDFSEANIEINQSKTKDEIKKYIAENDIEKLDIYMNELSLDELINIYKEEYDQDKLKVYLKDEIIEASYDKEIELEYRNNKIR